jgi:hypothetical protein
MSCLARLSVGGPGRREGAAADAGIRADSAPFERCERAAKFNQSFIVLRPMMVEICYFNRYMPQLTILSKEYIR